MTYPTAAGSTASITPTYETYSVQTNFGCSGVSEYSNTSVPLLSQLTLPDGRSYTFQYEPGPTSGAVTGRLALVTLPAGGSIGYSYPPSCGTGFTRTVNDGNGSSWSYTYSSGTNASHTPYVSITDNTTGAYEEQTFVEMQSVLGPIWNYKAPLVPTSNTYYTSSGTEVRASTTTYTSPNAPRGTSGAFYPLASITTTTSIPVNNSTLVTQVVTTLDPLQRPSQVDLYGYGAGSPGDILRTTKSSYDILGPLYNLTASVQQLDQNGAIASETAILYDEVAVTTTNNVPNHFSGVSYANPTTIMNLLSGTNTWQSKHAAYFDTGNPKSTTDVNSSLTTYSYNSCGNSLLSGTTVTVSSSVTLATSESWNCTSVVPISHVDVNGNVTAINSLDSFDRPVSAADPLGNVTNYSYPTTSSNSSEASMVFLGSQSSTSVSDVVTTYDGLGRSILTQRRQSPSVTQYDTVQTSYNSLGLVYQSSQPFSSARSVPTASPTGVTNVYDGIGRILEATDGGGGFTQYAYTGNDVLITTGPNPVGENEKRRMLEYDAAGVLSSVCELTSLQGSGACGQTVPATGYWTKYSSSATSIGIVQNAQSPTMQQTRSVTHDLIGRTTAETIPELGQGAPGTIVYAYDSDPSGSCTGSFPGDLVKRIDNAGDTICMTYDTQHRVVTRKAVSGPYASNTSDAYYVYDVGSVGGSPLQNVKGRLAEAYTCSNGGACSARLTDLYYSFSPEYNGSVTTGRLIQQLWEATSYGLTQSSEVVYANGQRGQMSIANSILTRQHSVFPLVTYSLDGEGRISSVVDSTNSLNLVTGTLYNESSQLTSIQYGNGDSDAVTPDVNTGRINNFTNTIVGASAPTMGTLQWNTDGSLHEFQWTDGADGSQNQVCIYGDDDLKRLASVNCGSPWNQTFTYDAFGNVDKVANGGTTYAPTYSATTNQVYTGAAASYDLNGNQTSGSSYSQLSYDALGQPYSISGPGHLTYDALGRLVAYQGNQIIYGPGGDKLAVAFPGGSTATVILTGGSEAYYINGSLAAIFHKDWLSSTRLATTWSHGVYGKASYAPFGEVYNTSGSSNSEEFTGKLPGLWGYMYDFPARQYDSSSGRWSVPDPGGWNVVDLANPQSLNRYAYAGNMPTNTIDPSGLSYCIVGAGGWDPYGGSIIPAPPEACVSYPDDDYFDIINGAGNSHITPPPLGTSGQITCDGVACGYVFYTDTLTNTAPPGAGSQLMGTPTPYAFGGAGAPSNPSTPPTSRLAMVSTPQQQQEQALKDKIGHGCTAVSGLLVLGDAAILFSGQEYLAPAALSLSFHVWAACGLLTW
jgi:RHS repeat-associated protein